MPVPLLEIRDIGVRFVPFMCPKRIVEVAWQARCMRRSAQAPPTGGGTMRRGLIAAVLGVGVLALSGTATADPNGPNVRGVDEWNCDGQIVQMESGPFKNAGACGMGR